MPVAGLEPVAEGRAQMATESADMVRRALEETLRRQIPQVELVRPRFEAVVGAAILGATSGELW